MKRILQVTGSLNRNGTETFMMNLYRHINRQRFSFDFLLYTPTDNGYEQEARELGAKIYYFSPRNENWKKHISSLRFFFKEHQGEYDAIHFNGNSFSGIMPLRIAKEFGVPIRIIHSHNSSTKGFHNKILHKLNRRYIHTAATHFLACSEEARKWGFKGSKVYQQSIVIPNGIDLLQYQFNQAARADIRKELGISPNTLLFGSTAGFRAVKNQQFTFEVFEKIKMIHPDSALCLCGSGETRTEIENLVKSKHLSESVHFMGIRTDVHKILNALDVYIFPSFYEGLPFALIEAQASGLPILASDSISPEIKLTPSLRFMSLDSSAEIWAKEALNLTRQKRLTEIHKGLCPYDIKTTCRILEEIYDG